MSEFDSNLDPTPELDLPSPSRERWQPLRSGLINLFKYENQIFEFANGHLLLRGNNGSGKSRVLALQLPFLLDGEMSPYRVEPDRDPAKKMEWNLLMGQHERRIGYTWIEFGRRDAAGEEIFLTLGCGMDARKGAGLPNRWFFITAARVGRDFELTEGKQPLSARQLEAVFEESQLRADLYKKTSEYRAAVDDALFGLGARYTPLLNLLIQLRQPQLMRDMKEEALSDALSEAMPPLREELVANVAESFQGLESDRQKTDDHREMLESVEMFRDGYQQYLSVAVRRLCEVLRNRHSQFEAATKDLRKIETELENTAANREAAATRVTEKQTQLAALNAELEGLRASPEMREKHNLDQVVRRADELKTEADEATAALAREEARLASEATNREQREADCERIQQALDADHRALREKSKQLGEDNAADFFDWSSADLASQQSSAKDFTERRARNVEHLEQHNTEIANQQRELDQARVRLDDARSQNDDAEETVTASQTALQSGIDAFGDAVQHWQRNLELIDADAFLRGNDWAEELAAWLETQQGEFAFSQQITSARDRVSDRIAGQEAEAKTQRKGLVAERESISSDLAELRSGYQPEPAPPPTRAQDFRKEKAGAPFWREVEFCDAVPADEHAGWEAALEASGLLDAWISPDLDRVEYLNDDFLVIGDEPELPENASLAAVLQSASGGRDVGPLLRRIGNHRAASGCWIDQTGNWANGLHCGHFQKNEAAYIGAKAREAARRRKIAELETLLGDYDQKLAAIDAILAQLDEQKTRLATEINSAPDITSVERLAADLERAQADWQRAKQSIIAAQTVEEDASVAWQTAVLQRDADATDFGLIAWAEPEQLADYRRLLGTFRDAAMAFWPEWRRFLEKSDELQQARSREDLARSERDNSDKRRREKHDAALQARTHADTLLRTIGATVEQLLANIQTASGDAKQCREALEKTNQEVRAAEIKEASLQATRIAAAEKRESSENDRDAAVGRMETFVEQRLFDEIDPDFQPDRTEFSATAAVDLARRMEKELKAHNADDERWGRMQSAITQSFHEFSDQLGRHGHVAVLSTVDETSVNVIRCEYQTTSRTVRELRDLLDKELADRRRFFEEKEREIIENHLIGEAAFELQRHIREGEESVLKMNQEMAKVTTSSGIQLRFGWTLADTTDDGLNAVRRIFLKTSRAWTQAEREQIGGFLQERIQREREADDTVSWREHLTRALDYRAWHRFIIERKTGADTAWHKLTKKTFGTGSGGEKALTLTVPQFAAAAAHYQSARAHAPRLILLDEVFVGIDDPAREQMMGLLESFDLDYVMTSQEMWGTFRSVSALAIYNLVTRPGFNAIAVTRWLWNGRDKLRSDEREPT